MVYSLRHYQKKAVIAGVETFLKKKSSIAVLPTGSGKSLVIAGVAKELLGSTIVFQPNKEILEQNLAKMHAFGYGDDCAVFSASLGQKDIGKITFATIGSIYNRRELWDTFDNCIIDEAHTVNADGGMYKEFIKAHGGAVFGLTATPYRLHQYQDGYGENYVVAKFLHRTRPRIFETVSHITQIKEMYDLGFLAPVEYVINDAYDHSKIKLNSTGRDFDDRALKTYNEQIGLVQLVADAIRKEGAKHILVFNKFVHEAEDLGEKLRDAGISAETVSAETKKADRERILSDFRNGITRVVTNVGVLTTGFDFPELDCVILARPTQSVALYYQMIGRGVRIAQGKDKVKVIDVCGNVPRFGRIESFEIVEPKPNLHRLQSDSSFLTGYDFVHEVDAEETDFKGLSKVLADNRKSERERERTQKLDQGILTFGKYEGQNIKDIPDGYIDWVIENFEAGKKRSIFENERERRNTLRTQPLGL